MAFLLADSFQSSLEKLSGEEQKAAKIAAFELQINSANPGLQCHRLDNIKDKNFWSARASRDIRLIFHQVESSVMLCYVDHHDLAYDWASRRKIETHPVTGAAQIPRVQGSAGTGKTVVALHRAVHLTRRKPEARVLLTTFSEPLADLLQDKLHRLIQGEPSLIERLDVLAMQELGERMHTAQLGKPQLITPEDLRALIQRHAPAEISRIYGEAFTSTGTQAEEG